MKKLAVFLVVMLLIGTGVFFYYAQPEANIEESEAASSFQSLSPEMQLFARTLDAEARGEPYIGQVAVGAVIMNRIRDSRFPNTLSGVIYQPWAFTAVARGHIWEETPSDQIVKATLAAYRGWDPTYGCVYYYNAAKVETNWIFSRKTVRTIGKHIFAK
ncbi:N-acetylmuramoyl-L-alanine amidase [Orenia metallireducens]|jgi:N-acetylmuramoyl-L-alanine amidase|uniref:N-acetylmuramoyl-L-alanine amidase n=1 Tax=Orenia metallireducens TaxID=1413210 RepID=A0A285GTZ4_9FIRM|nr:cell wall hydrolase [Orenia metallireducens]PRX25262.1 N-acetylmuramoyl-L-alanine amidase [Orenia metallireducens]SNY27032.1 N-acetylmuramoyl-L-alanine amidase [Orenia metallireducens]